MKKIWPIFFRSCHSKHYTAKSSIIRPGDSADTLYYLREGSVTIVMENEHGEELIVAHLNQGDFLGEIGLFSETVDRTVTVRGENRLSDRRNYLSADKEFVANNLKRMLSQVVRVTC